MLEAVLILRAADAILDREVLHRLHVERDAGEVRDAALQAPDDVARRRAWRSASGFRLICTRPLLGVTFVPSTPMNDEMLSTAGSFSSSATSACWRSDMPSNDTVCGASVTPMMTPVSWTGKKPFGTM